MTLLRRFRVWWTLRRLRRRGLVYPGGGLTPLGRAVAEELNRQKGWTAPEKASA